MVLAAELKSGFCEFFVVYEIYQKLFTTNFNKNFGSLKIHTYSFCAQRKLNMATAVDSPRK